jgi:type III pantothenate kinase
MLIAVDIGNTKIKAAVFEGDALLCKFIFDKKDAQENFKKIFEKNQNPDAIVFSSVGADDEELLALLRKEAPLFVLDRNFNFPFQNKYSTPQTLGIDRMVLAAGAVLQFPFTNRLVIDAGTCATYDFIDTHDNYLGGAISPGLHLRYAALHNFTAKLPLLSAEMPNYHIGNSTQQSIHSGVVNGYIYEIEGFIYEYSKQYQDITIILTGGDAEFLAKRLKNTIFANSNFLLESLNNLYTYTIKND